MFFLQEKFGILWHLQKLALNSQTGCADKCVSAALWIGAVLLCTHHGKIFITQKKRKKERDKNHAAVISLKGKTLISTFFA